MMLSLSAFDVAGAALFFVGCGLLYFAAIYWRRTRPTRQVGDNTNPQGKE